MYICIQLFLSGLNLCGGTAIFLVSTFEIPAAVSFAGANFGLPSSSICIEVSASPAEGSCTGNIDTPVSSLGAVGSSRTPASSSVGASSMATSSFSANASGARCNAVGAGIFVWLWICIVFRCTCAAFETFREHGGQIAGILFLWGQSALWLAWSRSRQERHITRLQQHSTTLTDGMNLFASSTEHLDER